MRVFGSWVLAIVLGSVSVASAQGTAKPEETTEKKADIRIMGGFVHRDGGGFLIGGGFGFRPWDERPQVEIAADAFYYAYSGAYASGFVYNPPDDESGDSSGLKGFYGSVNGIYNFTGNGTRTLTPFVGAGVGIASGGGTTVRPQILGGVDFPLATLAMRAEIRVFFSRGRATTIGLVGIQF